jgi:hypothetical protein
MQLLIRNTVFRRNFNQHLMPAMEFLAESNNEEEMGFSIKDEDGGCIVFVVNGRICAGSGSFCRLDMR